jgi:hypothetical protein
MEAPKE